MIQCPSCGAANIPGADVCDACHQALTDLHLPEPTSPVVRRLLADRIGALAHKPVRTVSPQTPVGEVLRVLMGEKIGCVVVETGGAPVGIFTERDALTKLRDDDAGRLDQIPVSAHMTAPLECLEADAKVAFAIQRMDLGGYRHIPIVDDAGRLVGIISVRDILDYLTKMMSELGDAP